MLLPSRPARRIGYLGSTLSALTRAILIFFTFASGLEHPFALDAASGASRAFVRSAT